MTATRGKMTRHEWIHEKAATLARLCGHEYSRSGDGPVDAWHADLLPSCGGWRMVEIREGHSEATPLGTARYTGATFLAILETSIDAAILALQAAGRK